MYLLTLLRRAGAVAAAFALLTFSGWASADPPSRVARLGYMSGTVSFSPAGEDDWVRATLNRPLTSGDRLWSDARARAEIEIGGAMVRLSAGTGMALLNLDDRIAQLQLTQGTLNVRVRRLAPGQVFEVDTPNLPFTLRAPGEYRIEVDPDGNATTIIVRKGRGEAYGEEASYVIDAGQAYRFTGTDLREYDFVDAPRADDFDRWASARDSAYDRSTSARYVSPDVIGYQDLDANGTWRVDPTYGNVWSPNRVASDWAPYRDGHWAWVDPWGWTWVDDQPWGFAVSHYGRWANFGGRWGWVPGPVRTPAYYAPALVVFVGGANFQLSISSGNVGGVGWFPLAPREVYRPSYTASRGYFENVNRSNTVINTTVINNYYTNYYNNTNVTNIVYANRQVPGAVVAVPTTTFVQSQPVARAVVRMPRAQVTGAPIAVVAPIAPTERSVRGSSGAGDKPPPRVFERPVVARTAPPAAAIGFAAQQPQLADRPGRPLEEAVRKALKPSAAAPAPVVKVVPPAHAAPPTARPPTVARNARADDPRAKPEDRKAPAAPVAPVAPVAPIGPIGPAATPPRSLPPQVTPLPAEPRTPAPRGPAAKPDKPDKPDQRELPAAKPQPQPPVPVQPQAGPPRPTAPAPEPPAREPGDKGDARGRVATPPAAPVAPPARAPEQKVATPPAAAPAPVPQRAEPPGKSEQRGNAEPRGQAAPRQRPQAEAEPKAAPPPAARPMPVAPKVAAPPPPVAPRATPEPAPAAKQPGPRPPAAAPKAPPPQAAPASQAEPRGNGRKPAAGKSGDKKKDGDEP